MEEPWEFLTVPAEIQSSSFGKETSSDCPEPEKLSEKTEGNNKSKQIAGRTTKLCGFLNKLGAKGLKRWKMRWFVYDERKCRLYYYRTPQDATPLGVIDVANASFSFDVVDAETLNEFHINTPERTYQLQAKDKQTMMFWLQELQGRRQDYSKKKANLVVHNKGDISFLGQSTDGLLAEEKEIEKEKSQEEPPKPIIEPVPVPHSVGEEAAAIMPPSQSFLSNISYTNLKTEINNMRAKRASLTPMNISGPLTEKELAELLNLKDETKSSKVQSSPNDKDVPVNDGGKSTFQSHIAIVNEEESEETKASNPQQQENAEDKKKISANFLMRSATLRRKFANSRSVTHSAAATKIPPQCAECKKLQESLAETERKLSVAQDESQMRQDVIESLHQVFRKFEERENNVNLKEQDGKKSFPEEIKDKLIYIAQLEEKVKEQTQELERVDAAMRANNKELRECRDQIQMFQEMTAVKDQVVVSLTHQLYALEKSTVEGVEVHEAAADDQVDDDHQQRASKETKSAENFIEEMQEIGKLKETCQAYVLQNRFLNSEILEFNKLRANDASIIRAQQMRLATVEAEMCKYKSKYFLVLREFQKPRKDGDSIGMEDDVISRLVEDAIDSESREILTMSRSSIQPFDRWGFKQNLDGDDEEAFYSVAQKMDRRSEQLKANLSTHEMSVEVKWENYMIAHKNRDFQKTPELKALIRSGIPDEHRADIWKHCINTWVQETRREMGDGYYQQLLESTEGKPSPAVKQIELDLLRTLPNNKHYEKMDSDGIAKLREVLLAYSWHNPDVGYCQGLNRLVAIALLYLTQEESFWCLVAIVEILMPKDYYSKTLMASQADQRVLRDLLAEKLPRLSAHFESLNVDLSLVSFNWFLTVFVDNFPVETTLRVWDTFLFEGNKILFRFALAVFKNSEELLLKCTDHMSAFNFLRQMPEKITDSNSLCQIAFQLLNPFPMKMIRSKRAHYLEIVQGELAELDKLRQNYVSNKADDPEEGDGEPLGED
ncbi:TBC1 domain family member 2B-like isoform X1 [Acropora muricata]|uniref:TBC1 domain family member 2B-like isoform X1 n=1 Tax=Acropora muricata TaxID=159855 RepID=UPI0034E54FE0